MHSLRLIDPYGFGRVANEMKSHSFLCTSDVEKYLNRYQLKYIGDRIFLIRDFTKLLNGNDIESMSSAYSELLINVVTERE